MNRFDLNQGKRAKVWNPWRKVYAIASEARYVWLGTSDGLHRYDKQTDRWFAPRMKGMDDEEDDTPSVTCLTVDEKYAWLGTNSGRFIPNGLTMTESER